MSHTRSKTYLKKSKLVDKNKAYNLDDALDLIKKLSYSTFNGSVDLHINLKIDPKKSDQRIRTTVTLPHNTGRKRRILVIAKGKAAQLAKKSGADIVGDEKTIERISSGWLDFDAVVATPEMMSKLVKVARILGPKGLMPNPKTGTVTEAVDKAIESIKKGQVTLSFDKEPIIHTVVGHVSQEKNQLKENITTLLKLLKQAKPSKIKEDFIKSIYLSATMSPSIKLKDE